MKVESFKAHLSSEAHKGAKSISHLNRSISSAALYVFFKTAGYLPTPKKQRAKDLADFYKIKRNSTREGRKLFGRYLIHPAINTEKTSTFRKAANPKLLRKVSKKAKYLSRIEEKRGEKFCFAASMSCIGSYIKLKRAKEKDPFSLATQIYKNGISEELAITQAFEHKIEEILKNDDPSFYKKKILNADALFAKLFEFKLHQHFIRKKAGFAYAFMKDAKPGIYSLNLLTEDFKNGHSFVVIKNKDKSLMIYDPNFGAAHIPAKQAEAKLKSLLTHRFYKGLDQVVFAQASPLPRKP